MAAHQPSAKRSMLWAPHLSSLIYCSGTPVSLISITSNRQQQARQLAQVMAVFGILVTGMLRILSSAHCEFWEEFDNTLKLLASAHPVLAFAEELH